MSESVAEVSVASSPSSSDKDDVTSYSTKENVDDAIKDFIVEDDKHNCSVVLRHVLNKMVGDAVSNELGVDLSKSESQYLTRTLISIMRRRSPSSSSLSGTSLRTSGWVRRKRARPPTSSSNNYSHHRSLGGSRKRKFSGRDRSPSPSYDFLSSGDRGYPFNRKSRRLRRCQDFPLMKLDSYSLLPTVLKFLDFDDLNSLAIMNHRLCDLRNNESLDQTRTATLDFSNLNAEAEVGSGRNLAAAVGGANAAANGGGVDSLERLLNYIRTHRQRLTTTTFQGNRTNLRLKGFLQNLSTVDLNDDIPDDYQVPRDLATAFAAVTSLDLSYETLPDIIFKQVRYDCFTPGIFGTLFPNVTKIKLLDSPKLCTSYALTRTFPNLVSLSACCDNFLITRFKNCEQLRFLDIREAVMNHTLSQSMPPSIERLDIFGVRYRFNKIPDDFIIDLIRNRPQLTWIRCEISDQGRLQILRERNDITVINT